MDRRQLHKAIVLVLIAGFVMYPIVGDLAAQCPMCRMAAETNLQNGGTEGRGLNTGILYMLSLPYLLIGTIGFIWWRNKRKVEE